MSATSDIGWTGGTWNPTVGCSRVSEGCRHCYAEVMAWRHVLMCRALGRTCKYEGTVHLVSGEPRWTGVVRLDPDSLDLPLRWRAPRRIFIDSMSDLFHAGLADVEIDRVFAVMALAPHHTFQVLTKRPKRMRAYLSNRDIGLRWLVRLNVASMRIQDRWAYQEADAVRWTREGLPNVWLGTSVENQATFDERVEHLLATPAALRFLSMEPLLEYIDIDDGALDAIGWVIMGCERLPRGNRVGRLPCDQASSSEAGAEWAYRQVARRVHAQCRAAGVAFFQKQMPVRGRVSTDLAEWDAEDRVQEFPR